MCSTSTSTSSYDSSVSPPPASRKFNIASTSSKAVSSRRIRSAGPRAHRSRCWSAAPSRRERAEVVAGDEEIGVELPGGLEVADPRSPMPSRSRAAPVMPSPPPTRRGRRIRRPRHRATRRRRPADRDRREPRRCTRIRRVPTVTSAYRPSSISATCSIFATVPTSVRMSPPPTSNPRSISTTPNSWAPSSRQSLHELAVAGLEHVQRQQRSGEQHRTQREHRHHRHAADITTCPSTLPRHATSLEGHHPVGGSSSARPGSQRR